MELKDQVCSLESARKLKELGVKQESLFYWHETARLDGINNFNQSKINSKYCYSAFTVAELGDMLPEMVDNLQILTWKKTWREQMTYFCEHRDNVFSAETEAEARAKMLIYLLENKLI